MTQLIINGIALPKTSRGKYACHPESLSTQVEMISGRRVFEVRGNVQVITYAYDYMGNDLMRQVLAALRSKVVSVQYLPDDSDELRSGEFTAEITQQPVFAFDRNGVPYWHNIAFTLREVEPHD